MRMAPKLRNDGPMLPWLVCGKTVDVLQLIRRILDDLISNGDDTVRIFEVIRAFTMRHMELENRSEPYVLKGIEMTIVQSFKTQL